MGRRWNKTRSIIDQVKKRKPTDIIIVMFTSVCLLLSGCIQGNDHQTNNTGNTTVSNQKIVVNRVHSGSYIQISGTSILPDRTVLLSKLFEDDNPLSWWPEDQEIMVKNGEWEITVTKSENITASDLELRVGPDYDFYIWERDNPEIKSNFYFDLVGPPVRAD